MADITHIAFDVDGTLYGKHTEYREGAGSIGDAHHYFIFYAWQMIRDGEKFHPELVFLIKKHF